MDRGSLILAVASQPRGPAFPSVTLRPRPVSPRARASHTRALAPEVLNPRIGAWLGGGRLCQATLSGYLHSRTMPKDVNNAPHEKQRDSGRSDQKHTQQHPQSTRNPNGRRYPPLPAKTGSSNSPEDPENHRRLQSSQALYQRCPILPRTCRRRESNAHHGQQRAPCPRSTHTKPHSHHRHNCRNHKEDSLQHPVRRSPPIHRASYDAWVNPQRPLDRAPGNRLNPAKRQQHKQGHSDNPRQHLHACMHG